MPICPSSAYQGGFCGSSPVRPAWASSQLWCPPAVARGGSGDVEGGVSVYGLRPAKTTPQTSTQLLLWPWGPKWDFSLISDQEAYMCVSMGHFVPQHSHASFGIYCKCVLIKQLTIKYSFHNLVECGWQSCQSFDWLKTENLSSDRLLAAFALLTGLRGGRDLMNSRMISCALFFNLGGMSPFTWNDNGGEHFKDNENVFYFNLFIYILWLLFYYYF